MFRKRLANVLTHLHPPKKDSEAEREIERLRSMPRYTKGISSHLIPGFHFVDPVTFLAGYDQIIRKRIYEFTCATENPLIIDCGSNIGLSIYFFKQLYKHSRVQGFEPDPDIFAVLAENIRTFQLDQVELFAEAIWTSGGSIEFQKEGGFSGRIPKPGDDLTIVKVPARRLRDLLTNPVNFLKIDIEGAEYPVLLDIEDRLENVENLFVEYHSHSTEHQRLGLILELLENNGFRYHIHEAFVRGRPFIDVSTCMGMDLQLDIFAYRR